VTGVVGTITARCEYLGETPRMRLEHTSKEEPKESWFAESRVELIEQTSEQV
jgi:hypothetical protein